MEILNYGLLVLSCICACVLLVVMALAVITLVVFVRAVYKDIFGC